MIGRYPHQPGAKRLGASQAAARSIAPHAVGGAVLLLKEETNDKNSSSPQSGGDAWRSINCATSTPSRSRSFQDIVEEEGLEEAEEAADTLRTELQRISDKYQATLCETGPLPDDHNSV